jgi:hypothetical protein
MSVGENNFRKKNVSQRHHLKVSSGGTSSYRKTPQPAAGTHMRWYVNRRRKGHLKKKGGKVGRLFFGIVFLVLVFLFFLFGGPSWVGESV